MSSIKQKREFKKVFDAFLKTEAGKKQYTVAVEALESVDWERALRNYLEYFNEIPPNQSIDELGELLYKLRLENTLNKNWGLEKIIDFLPHLIEHQKEREQLDKNQNVTTNDNSLTIDHLPDTPLKDLFKDVCIYNKVIKLMIDKKLIINNQEILIWKGFKANRKIDVVAFLEVLYSKNILNQDFKKIIFQH
jgi:hypothetical protein